VALLVIRLVRACLDIFTFLLSPFVLVFHLATSKEAYPTLQSCMPCTYILYSKKMFIQITESSNVKSLKLNEKKVKSQFFRTLKPISFPAVHRLS
jgi:hypothetical protein